MQNTPKRGSGEQSGIEMQSARPVRATGLVTARRVRPGWRSRRSLPGRATRRPVVATALVIAGAIGLGVLLRARAENSNGLATAPDVTEVPRPPTEMPVEAIAPPQAAVATATGTVSSLPEPTSHPPTPTPAPQSTVAPTVVALAADAQRAPVEVATNTPTAAPADVVEPEAVTPIETPTPVAEPEAVTPTETPTPEAEPAPLPVPPSQPSQPTRGYRTYTVQRGDILKQIAARYGVSMVSILAINNIPNPDSLRIGQVLLIPPPGS